MTARGSAADLQQLVSVFSFTSWKMKFNSFLKIASLWISSGFMARPPQKHLVPGRLQTPTAGSLFCGQRNIDFYQTFPLKFPLLTLEPAGPPLPANIRRSISARTHRYVADSPEDPLRHNPPSHSDHYRANDGIHTNPRCYGDSRVAPASSAAV